jgi:ribonuclease P protein component
VSVAVVVAKKYAKHATDRHMFKRRVFSVLSEQGFTSLLAQERVVVFPLRSLEQISFGDIEEDIIQCLRAAPWKSAL